MAVYVQLAKWRDFQHYKDRSPPWIKLHRSLLTSPPWVMGGPEVKALILASMLLAAVTDNRIPADLVYWQRVGNLNFEPDLGFLIDHAFLELIDEQGAVLARDSRSASEVLARASSSSLLSSPVFLNLGDRNSTPSQGIPGAVDVDASKVLAPDTGSGAASEALAKEGAGSTPAQSQRPGGTGGRFESGDVARGAEGAAGTADRAPAESGAGAAPRRVNGHRYREDAREVLAFLNEKAGKAFQPTDVNLALIEGRLKEGYTAGQCRQVVVRKLREWKDDDIMRGYLRPATLFNREKFNQYAGELVAGTEDAP